MTTLMVVTTPGPRGDAEALAPLPWRRMVWVTWRQHRPAVAATAALLGVVTVGVWILGLHLHHVYAAAISCHAATSLVCGAAANSFDGTNRFLANGLILQAVPPLIGAFVGAPVIARELETGTFRFAWTQGFGRWRWALAKLVVLAVPLVVVAEAVSLLAAWYYRPYFGTANARLGLSAASPLAPNLFDLRGVAFAAWTLAAFAIGSLAGALLRRVVPAIAATLAAYAGLAVATGVYLRQHYLAPIVTTRFAVPSSAWVIGQQWRTKAGKAVSQSLLGNVLQGAPVPLAGKGGVPRSSASWHYLGEHGYRLWTTYQPASRYGAFQGIEAGWLLVASALAVAATVWLVRRLA